MAESYFIYREDFFHNCHVTAFHMFVEHTPLSIVVIAYNCALYFTYSPHFFELEIAYSLASYPQPSATLDRILPYPAISPQMISILG